LRVSLRRAIGSRRSIALVLAIALVLLASAIASVQARVDTAQREEARAGRIALREERASARRAAREALRSERAAARRAELEAQRSREASERPSRGRHGHGNERVNAVVTSTCNVINWTFRKFPNLPRNTIIERITVSHFAPVFQTLTFNGDGTAVLTAINAPPGKGRLDTGAKWNTNGLRGGFDIHSKKQCPPAPAFTIEKLQRIGSGSFTSSPLTGQIGQTVEYQMIVKNTGNVPLVLSNFTDLNCDAGTIGGGQGETPLAPGPMPSLGASTTYTCTHKVTSTNLYENNAAVTATPPPGAGSPLTHTSNTVVVNGSTSEPAFTIEKLQRIGSGSFTTAPLAGKVGQTVEYEIVVKNTGDTSLELAALTDANCNNVTPAGGVTLAVGGTQAYKCEHVLTSADQTAGSRSNSATATATPPQGAPITHASNTVVVTLATPAGPRVFVAYADSAENDHGGPTGLPSPWKGSLNVTFVGCGFGGTDSCPMSNGKDVYDAGAIRIDATSGTGALGITGAKVVIGPCTYEPWPALSVTIQPEHSLILTQTGKHKCTPTSSAEQTNFDTSESFLKSSQYQEFLKTHKCANDGWVPMITLTINGQTTTLSDTGQTLNTKGLDPDICFGSTEASNWVALQVAGSRPAGAAVRPAAHRRKHGRKHHHAAMSVRVSVAE
jgi:uncharacterized repeat protein (TIGR01451 family)